MEDNLLGLKTCLIHVLIPSLYIVVRLLVTYVSQRLEASHAELPKEEIIEILPVYLQSHLYLSLMHDHKEVSELFKVGEDLILGGSNVYPVFILLEGLDD